MKENKLWSTKVQSTELLYYSRVERFNEDNKDFWFQALKVKNGMKVLEVGCGGGHFTNMIKKFYPDCQFYGIDLDANHINFAKQKANELGLDVEYKVADISNLPFKDEEFDIVFSHTVVEHLPFDYFIKEQKRVLKKDGWVIVTRSDMHKKVDCHFTYLEDEIGKTFEKLKIERGVSVAKYLEEPDKTMQHLNEYGFKDIDFLFQRVIYYLPDTQTPEVALRQIRRNYECKLYNALFLLGLAENGEEFREELLTMLEKQYEKRKEMFENNQKIYDFQSSNAIIISARK